MSISAKVCVVGALALAAAPLLAQEMPVPKMFRGMEKGQWRTEMLEGPGSKSGKGMPAMTICTDNLMSHSQSAPQQKTESSCKRRLLKDTADEAVMESVCPDRTATVTIKRESAKSMLMDLKSTSQRGPMEMKARYTYLGACRQGQGTISYDKNSEQCVKIREAAKKADPENAKKMLAMCS